MSDPRARLGIGVAVVFVAIVLVAVAIAQLTPSPSGPASSSYTTTPFGLAAYAAVLERSGHSVRRLRTPIASKRPRAQETLFVVEPDTIEPKEARAIAGWVREGGRLVVVANDDVRWIEELVARPPRWAGGGGARHTPLVPVRETAGVGAVESLDGGEWRRVGSALPVIGPADAPLAVTLSVGRGTVVLVADSSPLQNRGLARADNAAFGLALAGKDVAFLETVHGYGVSRGFGGLPTSVKWTLLGLLLTTLVALWSIGRRFGEPEDPDTPLPPPRIEYVDALAASLVRAKEDRP